ncbi:hypothetical protein Cni_G16549 [Canna indica]|uniref:Uncharacterized protein n=1 Tax=Canna indica TaxID=4628 RepID=A0AAQ3QGW2_9LILI|nr:hypothetical protein Cni_G16549 [Canna indica]
MIRDNLKKEISPRLGLCIQVILVPRTSRASLVKAPSRSPGGNSSGQQTLIAHWLIFKSLESFLNTLKTNHVSLSFIHSADFFTFRKIVCLNSCWSWSKFAKDYQAYFHFLVCLFAYI